MTLLRLDCVLLILLTPIVFPVEYCRSSEIVLQHDLATSGQPSSVLNFLLSKDIVLTTFEIPSQFDSFQIKEIQIGLDSAYNYPSITTFGEYGVAFGDADFDNDVDADDFALFQECIGKAGNCLLFDSDFDGQVNETDFQQFQKCSTGANIPSDPLCGNLGLYQELKSPPLNALNTNVDILLLCQSLSPKGYMSGINLLPGKLNRIPVKDVDWSREMKPTGKQWIVNKEDGAFAIGIQYFWAKNQYGFGPHDEEYGCFEEPYDCWSPGFRDYSGHLMVDSNGCTHGLSIVGIYDPYSMLHTWYDLCHLGSPGNLIVRVVGDATPSLAPFGDADKDGDVDMDDFGAFQRCFDEESNGMVSASSECLTFDCNRNGFVDNSDFEKFFECISRPNVPADSSCNPCYPSGLCSGFIQTVKQQIQRIQRFSQIEVEKLQSQSVEAFPLLWIVAIAVLIAALYGGYSYWDMSQEIAAQRAFRDRAICLSNNERETVNKAILLLRNQWAYEDLSNPSIKKDPQAKKCGDFLWNEGYGEKNDCRIRVVPPSDPQNPNPNPTNLVAVQPATTRDIIIDHSVFAPPAQVEKVAMILYSEWLHIWNKGAAERNDRYVSNEAECQRLLEAFQRRHGVWINIHHGTNEGRAD